MCSELIHFLELQHPHLISLTQLPQLGPQISFARTERMTLPNYLGTSMAQKRGLTAQLRSYTYMSLHIYCPLPMHM